MTPEQLTSLVRDDSTLNHNTIATDYSLENRETITTHYDEISTTFIVDANLIANFWRYRLALNRPGNSVDYEPEILNQHPGLIDFVSSILQHYYNNDSILINFSPALLVTDSSSQTRFLYASSNFFCLENSILIHNQHALAYFKEQLAQFSLRQYLDEHQRSISEKYDGASILGVSLVFNVTRQPFVIFGHKCVKKCLQQQQQQQQQQQRRIN